MKKVNFLALAASITLSAVMCGCSGKHQEYQESSTNATMNQISAEKQAFADKVAKDFSTSATVFYVDSVADSTAFILTKSSDFIDISIGYGDFENEIRLSYYASEANQEGYDVLEKGLKSDLFGLSTDEQSAILSEIRNEKDKISFETDKVSIKGSGEGSTKAITMTTQKTSSATATEKAQSTSQLDVNSLSNEQFAEKAANDLSTNDIIFTVRELKDSIAFFDVQGTDKINAHVGFADFGNSITLSFHTDGGEDECYYTLLHFLESDLLKIDESDQIDILAHYLMDEIDYQQGRMRIKETIKDSIRVISFQL